MLELYSILDELNSIPDRGINETQYQHLQYKMHTASSELENLTEEAVTREIRETAAKLVQEAYEKLELKLPKQQTDHASSSQGSYEGPLQLLLDDGKGGFRLDEEALRSVVCQESVRHRKLVVLSVVGEFRRGKSFLLNFMVRYLRAKGAEDWLEAESQESLGGFMWRRDADPVTLGILIWPEAFLFGDNYAVVLLDTQGTFDMNSRMELNVFLFALSSLASSIQILNIHQRFQMDALTHLQYFVEYGNSVAKETKIEAFQKLLILKQEEISKSLINCYEKIDCFLMPYPGDTVAKNQEFRGALRGKKSFKTVHFTLSGLLSGFNTWSLVTNFGLELFTCYGKNQQRRSKWSNLV
ncbi:hypothetical protein B566_EDAN017980 [Ephemera danica]|nr:hypothetical protein B566_EDAN017980 [Ephemera danica]